MKIAPYPLSWSALQAWRRNVNQYLLYRLGYVSRMPALHRGIDLHNTIADVIQGRRVCPAELMPLYLEISDHKIAGVECELLARVNGARIRGRVDLVFADRPHSLSIVDIKTGKYSSQHAQQLHYYALLFLENGIGISDLAVIYWRPDSVPQVHRIAIDVTTLDALRQEAIETYHAIAAQHIPDELIVPVHGTTFVDSDLGIAEGTEVAIRPEQVTTDDGATIWGLRVYGTEGPLGWIPDSLKTRIRATSAKVFGSRSTNERRNGYIRLSISASDIDWEGIACSPNNSG